MFAQHQWFEVLKPSADDAHDWAVEELSKLKYSQSSSLFERLLSWLRDQAHSLKWLFGEDQPRSMQIAIFAALAAFVALLIFLALRYLPVWRASARAADAVHADSALFTDDRNSTQLFAAADEALRNHDLKLAIIERYRGTIRYLSEQGKITLTPGMTATEAAALGGAAIGLDELFQANASLFNLMFFSDTPATNDMIARSHQFMALVTTQAAAHGISGART